MFAFAPDPQADKTQQYAALCESAQAIVTGEPDVIANMANLAALIWQFVPELNWAGFYRAIGDELVLGPFIGKPACLRIAWGNGVCGTAAADRVTQIVADIIEFPGHIACDAETRSELVVPILVDGQVFAVIDLDSPHRGRFDAEDAAGIERIAAIAATAFLPAQIAPPVNR